MTPKVSYLLRQKRWWLMEPFTYSVKSGLEITVPIGFTYDLASIPRILWWAIAPHELGIAPPLIHDWIYKQKGKIGSSLFNREQADTLFFWMMVEEGVPPWRSIFALIVVRAFGWLYWRDIIR